MSDTFDHFQDALDQDVVEALPSPSDGVWEQRDGTPIAVKDMSDSHIRNTIALLYRKAARAPDDGASEWCFLWVETLEDEQKRRAALSSSQPKKEE